MYYFMNINKSTRSVKRDMDVVIELKNMVMLFKNFLVFKTEKIQNLGTNNEMIRIFKNNVRYK